MAKEKEMTREQRVLLASKGYNPGNYEVVLDAPQTMIIRSLDLMDFAVIYKELTGGTFLPYGSKKSE